MNNRNSTLSPKLRPSFARRTILMPLALAGCWFFWETALAVGSTFKNPANLHGIVRYTLADGLIGFVVCGALFLLYDRLRRHVSFRTFVFAAVALSALFATGWHALSALTRWWLGWEKELYLGAKSVLIGGTISDGITLSLFSVLFLAVDHWLQFGEQCEKAREATALAHQAQLQMLRYQLNPHFLFNALNSIRAMIVENPTNARQIVTELAEFLRYSLDGRGHESTIDEEIQAIENYLAIQRIRFEERLQVSMQIDPAAHDVLVPCFLVHPLVENAVKYGMETSARPLRLEIVVRVQGPDLLIRVTNSGRLLPANVSPTKTDFQYGTGTGLKNVRQRLALAFPDRHAFSLTESEGHVCAKLVLRNVSREESP